MKKALPYILSISLFAYLAIVLTFAAVKQKEVRCKGLQVSVDDSDGNVFIEEEDIRKFLNRHYGVIDSLPVASIDKDSMEHLLGRNPVIREAQVYHDLEGCLHVNITQRNPVLRVFAGEGYYVDEQGGVMPVSSKYTARVVVATGQISRRFACGKLYPFAMFLRDDDFWNALVEQIVVTRGEEVTLIPKVGNFRILLGPLEDVDRKMENLRLFLEKGISLKGWNAYKEINLKFKDQVVCVKR